MADSLPAPQRSRMSLGPIFTALGILMGGASLISLIQRWADVEIVAEIARDALSLYRQMMEQFHWALFSWWTPLDLPWGLTFEMPAWGMDLLAVWGLAAASNYRVMIDYGWIMNPSERQHHTRVRSGYRHTVGLNLGDGSYIWPWLIAPIVFVKIALLDRIRESLDNIAFENSLGDWLENAIVLARALAPAAVTLAFFTWNAIQITP